MENLGFESYLSEVKDCVDEAKEVASKKRRQSTKLENLGIPEEELLRQQQELFAKVNHCVVRLSMMMLCACTTSITTSITVS